MTRSHAIIHAEVLTPLELIHDGAVIWDGSTIARVGPTQHLQEVLRGCESVTSARGQTVAPGFIELHAHGALGHDVADKNPKGIEKISRHFCAHGTTAFVAALCYDPEALRSLRETCRKGVSGAQLLGLYSEGPFINPAKRGGIPEQSVLAADPAQLQSILGELQDSLLLMTLAPEIPGAMDLIPLLRQAGVVAAQGHSDASLETAREAAGRGATHLTHLYNAMSGLHHREPGLAALPFDRADVTAEITADGVHVHPAILRLSLRAQFDPPNLALITDSVRPAGMPDGEYTHLGRPMRLQGTRAALLDGTLVGSVITQDQALARVVREAGVPLQKALYMASTLPAKILGLDHERGEIAAGKRADMVMLDEGLGVTGTILKGQFLRPTELGER
ncbi:MAG: N-acetylglucosamine-6-phosphate deacetylase [Candidatus Omnitrophica bacterium]|nr:N-acetylglucosamine-6-phosphate deacetylase [Candidatus Omnitrophota bacterium]